MTDTDRHGSNKRSVALPTGASPDLGVTLAALTSIELAVVAQLNLELATAYDEVADDAVQLPETRQRARTSALQIRERAEVLRHEALRAGVASSVPLERKGHEPGMTYSGRERRERERRSRERRSRTSASADGFGGVDRRVNGDRRRNERRQAA